MQQEERGGRGCKFSESRRILAERIESAAAIGQAVNAETENSREGRRSDVGSEINYR